MRTLLRMSMPAMLVFKISLAALVLPAPAPFNPAMFHNESLRPPAPPSFAMTYSVWHSGPLEVAKVFGRTPGCQGVDAEFIGDVTAAAINARKPSKNHHQRMPAGAPMCTDAPARSNPRSGLHAAAVASDTTGADAAGRSGGSTESRLPPLRRPERMQQTHRWI